MKRKNYILILTVLMASCAPRLTVDQVRATNRENLKQLSIGMNKSDVLTIMSTETIKTRSNRTINNPYRSEILKGKDKTLEVLYYYTDLKKADNAITDDELTPLVFDSGKLIGWGWSFLDDSIQKYEIRIK